MLILGRVYLLRNPPVHAETEAEDVATAGV